MTTRADVAAPHWLRQLLTQTPAPIPWKRAVRAALSLAGPIAVGMALGYGEIGILVSVGALCVTFADTDGPYRQRAARISWAAAAGAVGHLVGGLVAGDAVRTAVVLVVVAGVSALVSETGSTASLAGLMLLVFAVVGSGQTADVWVSTACFVGGAAFALLLSLAAWPMRGAAVERAAVAEVYEALAGMLAACGTPHAQQARRELTAALNRAYDALLDARSRLSGRDRTYRKLFVLLTETTPIVEAAVALVNAGHPPPPEYVRALFDAAVRIRSRRPLCGPPELPAAAGPALTALHSGLRAAAEVRRGPDGLDYRLDERPPPLRERLREWLDKVALGRAAWAAAGRLALCVGLAVAAGELLPLDHSFWVPLTVAIVLKPDFGSVFGRAVLRALGTVVGVVIGAAVLAGDPPLWGLLLLVVVAAGALPVGQVRNYGMFSTFVTPLVIVQLDLANAGDWSLVAARLLDTGVGCAIVLIVGYLLWPGARRPRVGADLADTLDRCADYLAAALGGQRSAATLRRGVYRSLSDLRVAFQQSLAEPSRAGRQAAAWWPAIVGLERLADAVTGVAVAAAAHGPIAAAEVDALVAAVRDTAAAVRWQRTPARLPLPENDRLARVADEISTVRATLRGPGLD